MTEIDKKATRSQKTPFTRHNSCVLGRQLVISCALNHILAIIYFIMHQ